MVPLGGGDLNEDQPLTSSLWPLETSPRDLGNTEKTPYA